MSLSTLLHLECDPVEPVDVMKHVVFSCPQNQGANLEPLPTIASQRFAVMYDEVQDDHLGEMLERAHSSAALAPVKLVAVREHDLYIFLDATVASATLPTIAQLWESVVVADIDWPWSVSFALETEVGTGHSDFEFWEDAKEILESYSLGIEPFDSPADDRAELTILSDKTWALHDLVSEHKAESEVDGVGPHAPYPDQNQGLRPGANAQPQINRTCTTKRKILSLNELTALEEAVHCCGSLGDKCLRAMLMTGIRAKTIRSIKVEDLSNREKMDELRAGSLTLGGSAYFYMRSLKIFCEYLQTHHLASEDYLFRSAVDASKPLSTHELEDAFRRWLHDAQIKQNQLTPHCIRHSLMCLPRPVTTPSLAQIMGHDMNRLMSEYYVKRDQQSQ